MHCIKVLTRSPSYEGEDEVNPVVVLIDRLRRLLSFVGFGLDLLVHNRSPPFLSVFVGLTCSCLV